MKIIAQNLARQVSNNADTSELVQIFDSNEPFLNTVKQFDEWVSKYPELEEIREYLFDFLLANQIEKQRDKENYFDSPEWMEIEDKTLERGTELLNMILYISEARENDVEMELNDFLHEFLLVDEDGFQDEHHIYEAVIENEDLIQEEPEDMALALSNYKEEELGEMLRPLFLFFMSPYQSINWTNILSPVEGALYDAMMALNHN